MASLRVAQARLLTNAAVIQQLTASLMAQSILVLTEGSAVTNHVNRLAFANAVIGGPVPVATFMAPAILYNANMAAAASGTPDANGTPLADSDMDSLVATVFTAYAIQFASHSSTLQFGS